MDKDLISRSRLRKNMEFVCMGIMAGTEDYNAPLTEIDNAPTVEYTFEEAFQKTVCEQRLYCPERPKGEWITAYSDKKKKVNQCRGCGFICIQGKTNFCPNCGAEMRKEGEKE